MPVPGHLLALFREWLDTFYQDNPRRLIFVGREKGDGLQASNFHKVQWRPLLDRAGLLGDGKNPYHFHALRHFAVSWWIANGVPLTDASKLIGHSKVDMAPSVYAHAMAETSVAHAAAERMSRALIDAPKVTVPGDAAPIVAPELRDKAQPIDNVAA